ncbi:MAG: hypothetical protein ABIH46_08655 [Chloroflexota bacterium]
MAYFAAISWGCLLLIGCAPAGHEEAPPPATPSKPAECPNLESRLLQLVASPDPAEFAAKSGLTYADGSVRVVIEMGSRDQELPQGYSAKIETRSNGLIQAMVPLEELCGLSSEPSVGLIRAPLRAVPLKR